MRRSRHKTTNLLSWFLEEFACFTKGVQQVFPFTPCDPSEPTPTLLIHERAVYIPQSNIFSLITDDAVIWDKQKKDVSTVCSQSCPGTGARESESRSPVELQGMFSPAGGAVPRSSSSPLKITPLLPLLGHRIGSIAQQKKKPDVKRPIPRLFPVILLSRMRAVDFSGPIEQCFSNLLSHNKCFWFWKHSMTHQKLESQLFLHLLMLSQRDVLACPYAHNACKDLWEENRPTFLS